jgi:hypothetical protein
MYICYQQNPYTIHLHINSTDAVKPVLVAAVPAMPFQSIYSGYHYGLLYSEFLQLPPISQLYISKTTNSLRPSQSVTIDGAPGTIINGCTTKFAQLPYILYLSLLQEHFSDAVGKSGYCVCSGKN